MNRRFKKHAFFIFTSLFMLLIGYSLTLYCDELNLLDKMQIQDEILQNVRDAYIDSISNLTLYDGAIHGIIEKLDPHSSYMPPDTASEFNEKILGGFEGIGITFSIIEGKQMDVGVDGNNYKVYTYKNILNFLNNIK